MHDPFNARDTFHTGGGVAGIYRLSRLEEVGLTRIAALPYSIRVLLESVLRNCDGHQVSENDVRNLAGWQPARREAVEVPFKPARVVLQDFTGVPAVVDLAAMRSAMRRLGGDAKRINPLVPVDLVIDHSVQVDRVRLAAGLGRKRGLGVPRNRERYEFLRWGQKAIQELPRGSAGRWGSSTRSTWSSWQNALSGEGRRRTGGAARHVGGHRQPHDDD